MLRFQVKCVIISAKPHRNPNRPTHSAPQSTPDCTLTEPLYNHTFDLSGLRTTLAHKVALSPAPSAGFLELNACGPMQKRCAGISQVTVCHTDAEGRERVRGSDFQLRLRGNGQLELRMEGGACETNSGGTATTAPRNWRTTVQLRCSYGAPRTRPIEVIGQSECAFRLVWHTRLACLSAPLPQAECTALDATSGQTFDLTALQARRSHA